MMDDIRPRFKPRPKPSTNWARPRSAANWLAALLCLCVLQPAVAHQLRVFAAADGDLIRGSAYFAGGAVASGAQVRIESTDGTLLATPIPDAEGGFSWRVATPADYLIVVQSADGHRAEWMVAEAELAPAFAGRLGLSASAAAEPESAAGADAAHIGQPSPARERAAALDPVLESAIERAVARQVRPLREELAEARARSRVQDVIGGIGYIVGIAGLALWWAARGRTRSGSRNSVQEP